MNIVVTSGHLLPTIAKMIIYKLNQFVPLKNVYSSNTVGRLWCFRHIREQFPNCKIIVIGDGKEEETAASQESLIFYKINSIIDLLDLYSKLLLVGNL